MMRASVAVTLTSEAPGTEGVPRTSVIPVIWRIASVISLAAEWQGAWDVAHCRLNVRMAHVRLNLGTGQIAAAGADLLSDAG